VSSTKVKLTKNQTSWVWKYFKTQEVRGVAKYVCQAAKPPGSNHVCGVAMSPDPTQSTKSLARHLERQHKITPEFEPQQGVIKSYFQSGKMELVSRL
jgi:hypothetical protein